MRPDVLSGPRRLNGVMETFRRSEESSRNVFVEKFSFVLVGGLE